MAGRFDLSRAWGRGDLEMSTSNIYQILEFHSLIHSLIRSSNEAVLNAMLGPVRDIKCIKYTCLKIRRHQVSGWERWGLRLWPPTLKQLHHLEYLSLKRCRRIAQRKGRSGSTWHTNAEITNDPNHEGLSSQPPSQYLFQSIPLGPGNQNQVEEVMFTRTLEDVKRMNTLTDNL